MDINTDIQAEETVNTVSIMGDTYFEPISILLEELKNHHKNSNGCTNAYVNGFASSVCILSVVCLESYVMRVRYKNQATQDEIKKPVSEYLTNLYPDFPNKDELEEVFVIRDILAHNHLWEMSFLPVAGQGMKFIESNKKNGGDKKYINRVDSSSKLTKKLGLNIIPTEIGMLDAKAVIQTIWKILLFLENKNINQCYVSGSWVKHNGQMMKFCDVIRLPETWGI